MSYDRRISLHHAFKSNLSRAKDVNTTYKQNVVTVNTYINNVLSSSLPVVPVQPKNWQEYTTAWEAACTTALQWVNRCMARLLEVPQDVQNYNPQITALLNDAIAQTNTLINNPGNPAALAALNNDLTVIPSQLQLVEAFISGCITALQNFQDQLPAMAGDLTALSDLAIKTNQADKQAISDLQTKIKNLQNDIDSLTATIVALGITDAIALTLGVVASIVAFPEGFLTWFVLGPVVAVATTYIALDAEKIKADKTAIDQAQSQMADLTASCSVLATMSTTYTNLANQSETIQTALKAVLTEWQILSSDVATAITDIQTAVNDTKGAKYQTVLEDLQGALTEWNDADTQAASLAITMEVNTAQLQVGMSSAQVRTTLATGKTIDLITYFNQL